MRLEKALVPLCKVYGNGSDEQVFSVQYTAETDGETCVENRKLYLKTQTGWAGSGRGWGGPWLWSDWLSVTHLIQLFRHTQHKNKGVPSLETSAILNLI